jgi:hypothetical protein
LPKLCFGYMTIVMPEIKGEKNNSIFKTLTFWNYIAKYDSKIYLVDIYFGPNNTCKEMIQHRKETDTGLEYKIYTIIGIWNPYCCLGGR